MLSKSELTAIRERHRWCIAEKCTTEHRLLAYIDAMTEAVEGLEPIRIAPNAPMLDRAAVLALLQGDS